MDTCIFAPPKDPAVRITPLIRHSKSMTKPLLKLKISVYINTITRLTLPSGSVSSRPNSGQYGPWTREALPALHCNDQLNSDYLELDGQLGPIKRSSGAG